LKIRGDSGNKCQTKADQEPQIEMPIHYMNVVSTAIVYKSFL